MTTHRRGFWRATAGALWRRFFSTSPAAATRRARRRSEHGEHSERPHRERIGLLAAAGSGDDAALLVFVAFILAAIGRADLLAHGADDHLGFHPILRDAECEL